uniref:Uncharacterized protein n=1 Tax=Psilocybe cubensis TaxID=181762 RepID=A0A8H7XU76_PSICU
MEAVDVDQKFQHKKQRVPENEGFRRDVYTSFYTNPLLQDYQRKQDSRHYKKPWHIRPNLINHQVPQTGLFYTVRDVLQRGTAATVGNEGVIEGRAGRQR